MSDRIDYSKLTQKEKKLFIQSLTKFLIEEIKKAREAEAAEKTGKTKEIKKTEIAEEIIKARKIEEIKESEAAKRAREAREEYEAYANRAMDRIGWRDSISINRPLESFNTTTLHGEPTYVNSYDKL